MDENDSKQNPIVMAEDFHRFGSAIEKLIGPNVLTLARTSESSMKCHSLMDCSYMSAHKRLIFVVLCFLLYILQLIETYIKVI